MNCKDRHEYILPDMGVALTHFVDAFLGGRMTVLKCHLVFEHSAIVIVLSELEYKTRRR